MVPSKYRLIGAGVYSLPEAERLTRIPRARLRRWMEGYQFVSRGKRRQSPPIVASAIGREAGELALTFADLIEVRFLDHFLGEGVSWHAIRIASERARDLLSLTHPFSARTFKTDGRDILAEIVRPGGLPQLLNLVRDQYEFSKLVAPMLYAGIDFDGIDPSRWWPMSQRKRVVVDPKRSFGAPIVADGGVPTSILANAAAVEESQKVVAEIYQVPRLAVRYAVEFESKYLAA